MRREANFSELVGLTLTGVENIRNEVIKFTVDDGGEFYLSHDQSCCENVVVEDICGDLNDLVGTPILVAEDASSQDDPPGYKADEDWRPESQTWTFYKLRTIKGSVDIRWHGTSNGYYSESVSFTEGEPWL